MLDPPLKIVRLLVFDSSMQPQPNFDSRNWKKASRPQKYETVLTKMPKCDTIVSKRMGIEIREMTWKRE
jgi:hypothetical protein